LAVALQNRVNKPSSDLPDALGVAVSMAAKQVASDVKDKADNDRSTLIKWILVGVGVLVVCIGVLAVVAKLWKLAIFATVVGGLGAVVYLALKPKITALADRVRARGLAEAAAEQAAVQQQQEQAAAQAKVAAAAAAQKKLDDDLQALKRKL
jgi:hypothetical protein